MNSWDGSHNLNIQTGPDIVGGFSIGFEDGISEETKDILVHFAHWVEDHYNMPVTLWVDFEHKHYLRREDGKQTGYRFYWVPFATFPVFEKEEDIPVIRLAVRTDHRQILTTFTEAITCYFTWLTGKEPTADQTTVEEIMDTYQAFCQGTGHTF